MMNFIFFLGDMSFTFTKPMTIFCGNDIIVYIANNLVFYVRTKHNKADPLCQRCSDV